MRFNDLLEHSLSGFSSSYHCRRIEPLFVIVIFVDVVEFSGVIGRNRATVVALISFDELSKEESIDRKP